MFCGIPSGRMLPIWFENIVSLNICIYFAVTQGEKICMLFSSVSAKLRLTPGLCIFCQSLT